MKVLFSLLFMLFCISRASSQNYIYKGSQKYPATNSWEFIVDHTGIPGLLNVCVAKTKSAGYLMLSAETPFPDESISGNIFMILKNGKTITLTQKLVNDRVNDKSQVLYAISSTNYKLLQESTIRTIRFSLVLKAVRQISHYTATNREYGYMALPDEKYNTSQEIKEIQEWES